jgi:hypothetical protein
MPPVERAFPLTIRGVGDQGNLFFGRVLTHNI